MRLIEAVEFSLFSPDQVRKMSSVKITVPDTYDEDGYPIQGGLADQRLGVIDPGLKCKTCGGRMKSCTGHFGHIELVRPVIHVGFGKMVYQLLKAVCRKCSRVMTNATDLESVKRAASCPHCGEKQIVIKFVKPTNYYEGERKLLSNEIRERLERIPDQDLQQLGVKIRPELVVLTVLLVPPVNVRPSITLETGERSEDDLTHKLVDIIRINQRLGENIDAGAPQLIIEDLWELLQYHVVTYYDNETAGIPPARHRSGRQLKTLFQRLKGKEGRFRYNLSGKRVNFSARTVISPDPTLSINELGVPNEIASELTIPVSVTDWNLESIKEFIRSNASKVNYVIRPDNRRKKLTDANIEEVLKEIAPGYQIERQLVDGDLVIFNRQPSLHRVSMLCHQVKILPGKTFRFNVADCAPYNADYDGDEMNIHVPQNEEAQSEAKTLMKVEGQILSPRHGKPLIAPSLDHLSGLYLLTNFNYEFDRDEAMEILSQSYIEKPLTKKKISGQELFSLLLPGDFSGEFTNKSKGKTVFKKGQLVEGTIDSKVSNEIVREIFLKSGPSVVSKYIDEASRLSSIVVKMFGLSLSLEDYELNQTAQKTLEEIVRESRKKVRIFISRYRKKTLERQPGKTLKETLEEQIMDVLEEARSACNKIVSLHIKNRTISAGGKEFQVNPALMMANAGARGSKINVIQMAALVGQQAIRGKRPTSGYKSRLLPHFRKGDLSDEARGFVDRPFKKGLTPIQYFFHAAGGRDSVVDKGVNPAKTGYMQRRLVNAIQDFIVKSDLSVRDAEGRVVQFKYGDDALDITNGKQIAYGEPVGVVAAQSIGEPGTQMCVSAEEKVIVKTNEEIKIVKVGEFVDGIFENVKTRTKDGYEVYNPLEEIKVLSLDKNEKIRWSTVLALNRVNAPEKLINIKTRSGRSITATDFHSFVTRKHNQVVSIAGKELKAGDRIPVMRYLPENCISCINVSSYLPEREVREGKVVGARTVTKTIPNALELDELFGWFIGAYLSEGSANGHQLSISNVAEEYMQNARNFVSKLGLDYKEKWHQRGFAPSRDLIVSSTLLSTFISTICGKGASYKAVPEFAYNAEISFVKGLLRGYFDGDGNVSVSRKVIRASSNSLDLVKGIALLLTRLKIFARISHDKKGQWWLTIPYNYAPAFLKEIGLDILHKREALRELAQVALAERNYTLDQVEMISGFDSIFRDVAKKLAIPTRYVNNFTNRQKIGRATLERYIQKFETLSLQKNIDINAELAIMKQMLDADVIWDEITEVKYVDYAHKYVYDLSVPGDSTFTTFGGVITHNTLRTFHYAGVASLAQLGFTRLVEIVDGRKTPKKPVMEVYLKSPFNKDYNKTKQIAAEIEKVVLEKVAEVREDFEKKAIQIKFNEDTLKEHNISIENAVEKIKLVAPYEGQGGKTITIKPKVDTLRNVRKVTNRLRTVLLKGIEGINRAIIIEKEGGEYTLATEGSNLQEVFKIEAVDTRRTTTNDIAEISRVLGIEAGRNAIVVELLKVMEAQDMDVDMRHIMLIADSMTSMGNIESIGRHGLAGKKDSVFARAAFEETAKHLVNACIKGESDKLRGVTENIIIGQTIPVGTGEVELEMDVE